MTDSLKEEIDYMNRTRIMFREKYLPPQKESDKEGLE
jgi:hypothetical protein